MRPSAHVLCRAASGVVALAALGAARPAAAASVARIDAFAYATPAEAARAWRPGNGAPPPVPSAPPAAPGTRFPCPFAADGADRFFWDREISADLSACDGFEIDCTVTRPEAIRSLHVYFRSGSGWYAAGRPLARAGRQRVYFTKADFAAEDRPAGWSRIGGVRLSPWRGAPAAADLTLHAFLAHESPVVIVVGDASLPNAAERRAAAALAERLGRWLRELAVPYGVVEDRSLNADRLARARVAILAYTDRLPDGAWNALRGFAERGGRIVALYSSDARLAAWLGLRLEPYRRAERAGQWAAMASSAPRDWHLPPRVRQESGNVRPVAPEAADAQVIAWWEDADGTRQPEAAWCASPRGAWMSHLPDDNDALHKQHFFAALLAHYDPALWPAMARAVAEQAGQIDSFGDYAQAAAWLADAAGRARDPAAVRTRLDEADALHRSMLGGLDGPAALERARDLRDRLTRAYALTQPSAPGEFRAVWDHDAVGWYPGNWRATTRRLADAGLNAVLTNVLWPWTAHCANAAVPPSTTCRLAGDQLAACIAAAKADGLQVHAWIVCLNATDAPAAVREGWRRDGRLQRSADGSTLPWLCPNGPANRRLLREAARDLAARHAIDGIHLDYIRYPGAEACFCPACRAAFEAERGAPAEGWPGSAIPGGRLAPAFSEWRAAGLTRLVAEIAREARAARPGVYVSAAVYSNYPDCRASVGQDWGAWIAGGAVDFVCPMNYTGSRPQFESTVIRQLAIPGAAGRVFPGIGVTANGANLQPDQVVEQIAALRRAGAKGFALFDLDATLREDVLPILRLGPTRD
jgi:uncharacterized lipoprotein YddW (UPF0748 family)